MTGQGDGREQETRYCCQPSCLRCTLRPAPQQPPAQERKWRSGSGVISETMAEVEARIAADETAPPSEADSAGEDDLRAQMLALHKPYTDQASGRQLCDHDEFAWPCTTAALAASSGVQGGDGRCSDRPSVADEIDGLRVEVLRRGGPQWIVSRLHSIYSLTALADGETR